MLFLVYISIILAPDADKQARKRLCTSTAVRSLCSETQQERHVSQTSGKEVGHPPPRTVATIITLTNQHSIGLPYSSSIPLYGHGLCPGGSLVHAAIRCRAVQTHSSNITANILFAFNVHQEQGSTSDSISGTIPPPFSASPAQPSHARVPLPENLLGYHVSAAEGLSAEAEIAVFDSDRCGFDFCGVGRVQEEVVERPGRVSYDQE